MFGKSFGRVLVLLVIGFGTTGLNPLSAQQLGTAFVPITPCRMVDTRTDTSGGVINGTVRNLTLTGAAYTGFAGGNPCTALTGVPSSVPQAAIAVNLTMVGTAGSADLRVAPWGTTPASSVMNSAGPTVANAAVEEVAANGSGGYGVSVKSGGASFNLLVDILGYYTNEIDTNLNSLLLINESTGVAIEGISNGGPGLYGISSTGAGTSGFSSTSYGVWGTSFASRGVFGDSTSGRGAFGHSTGSDGVYGTTDVTDNSAAGVSGHGDSGAYGVAGHSSTNYGVHGVTASTAANAAGVFGVDGFGPAGAIVGFGSAGVRGESNFADGVLGVAHGAFALAVSGALVDNAGLVKCEGLLGDGLNGFDVTAAGGCGMGGSGPKFFVEPYPGDPSKEIRFVSLEGPESGTYFRGESKITNGFATIAVPEVFRAVTDADGLTVQLTPVGDLAVLGIASKDLNSIVVRGSQDVTFDYMVNGVRKAYKDLNSIHDNAMFVPRDAGARMSPSYAPDIKARLIANGIFNSDGSVNMATARKMGWDKIWEAREARASAAAPQHD